MEKSVVCKEKIPKKTKIELPTLNPKQQSVHSFQLLESTTKREAFHENNKENTYIQIINLQKNEILKLNEKILDLERKLSNLSEKSSNQEEKMEEFSFHECSQYFKHLDNEKDQHNSGLSKNQMMSCNIPRKNVEDSDLALSSLSERDHNIKKWPLNENSIKVVGKNFEFEFEKEIPNQEMIFCGSRVYGKLKNISGNDFSILNMKISGTGGYFF